MERNRLLVRLAALLLVFVVAALSADAAQAEVLRLDYAVKDLGGGVFEYEFVLTVDNADGTWSPGDGFGWLVIGDAPSAASPLTAWTPDLTDLPIGPWTSWTTSFASHNGPTLSPVLTQWVPTAVGQSLSFSGTSTANLQQGQLLFSCLFVSGTSTGPDFTVANRSPLVVCPPDQTVECAGPGGTPLTLNFQVTELSGEAMTVTIDVDGTNEQTTIVPSGMPPTSVSVPFAFNYPGPGAYLVEVSVTNTPTGDTNTCSLTVTVQDTQPPVITLTAPNPMTIECGSGPYVEPGYSASDVCDGDLTGSVVVGGPAVDTTTPATYLVTYNVSDGAGNPAVQQVRTVNVVDTTPPVVVSALARTLLWPARAGLLPVGLSATASDSCDPTNPGISVEIWSDESNGAAPFSPDASGAGTAASLALRAERAYPMRAERAYPMGDGRVYLVVLRATDSAGNVSAARCLTSIVPIVPVGVSILNVVAQAAAAQAFCLANSGAAPASFTLLHAFTIP